MQGRFDVQALIEAGEHALLQLAPSLVKFRR
jgi:hypothetical protein